MVLTCVIVDDEPLARECIANYVAEVDFLKLVGMGNNPLELIKLSAQHSIDLVFLDIQMPVMNGIDFLKTVQNLPMVIITTAYPNYALEGFQLDVMDYLVKPVTFDRFFKAAVKAKDYHSLVKSSAAGNNSLASNAGYFFIKCGNKFERIHLSDILFIEAMQNYVIIFTVKGKFVTLLHLKNVEQNLDKQSFIRVHKSFVVSIDKIESIENNEISIQSFRIPISRDNRTRVIEQVVNEKLWKR
jgi:two-component system, LytTR family, response regulator